MTLWDWLSPVRNLTRGPRSPSTPVLTDAENLGDPWLAGPGIPLRGLGTPHELQTCQQEKKTKQLLASDDDLVCYEVPARRQMALDIGWSPRRRFPAAPAGTVEPDVARCS